MHCTFQASERDVLWPCPLLNERTLILKERDVHCTFQPSEWDMLWACDLMERKVPAAGHFSAESVVLWVVS